MTAPELTSDLLPHPPPRFAFAETDSSEQIELAKSSMEGVEIQGRKLRVRSSKDSDKKRDREKRQDGRADRRAQVVFPKIAN